MRKIFLCFSLLLLGLNSKSQNLPYVNQTDVGLLFGEEGARSFSAQSFNGFGMDKLNIHLGFITGIDVYQPITLIPLAPSIKYFLNGEKESGPNISLTAGYAFSGLKKLEQNQASDGGTFFNPTFGLRFKTQRKEALNLSLGYKIQKGSLITYLNDFNANPRFRDRFVEDFTFKRVSITMGISF